jgi:hypothetical protein
MASIPMNRNPLPLAAFSISCLFVVGMSGCIFSSHKGEVLIVNQATETVLKGEIEVCKQRFDFQNIKPKERKQILYDVRSDSHYKIEIQFESGKKLTKELGYVTSGLDFKDMLIVTEDDILLETVNVGRQSNIP